MMPLPGFVLFATAIGRCGLAWNADSILALQLPEDNDAATRARLMRRCARATEQAPPDFILSAIEQIRALLKGERVDLRQLPLALDSLPAFQRRVYEMVRRIPPGETLSYGAVAERIGMPGSARAVGQALGKNPFALIVPCHRVLAAGGKLGGFSARGGTATKSRLLELERAFLPDRRA